MAADAIHRRVKLLTFTDCVSAFFVAIFRGGWSRSAAGVEIAHGGERQFIGGGRLDPKAALLALAAQEAKSEANRKNQESRNAGREASDVQLFGFPAFRIHFAAATCFGGSATRGTPYSSRMASTSLRLRCRIASI